MTREEVATIQDILAERLTLAREAAYSRNEEADWGRFQEISETVEQIAHKIPDLCSGVTVRQFMLGCGVDY